MKLSEIGNLVRPIDNIGESSYNTIYEFSTSLGDKYVVEFETQPIDFHDLTQELMIDEDCDEYNLLDELWPVKERKKNGKVEFITQLKLYTVMMRFAYLDGDEQVYSQRKDLDKKSAMEVLATVQSCVVDFLSKHEFDAVVFEADNEESSRIALYRRFIKMIATKLDFLSLEGPSRDGDYSFFFAWDPTAH